MRQGDTDTKTTEPAKKIQEDPEEELPEVDEVIVGKLSQEVSKDSVPYVGRRTHLSNV